MTAILVDDEIKSLNALVLLLKKNCEEVEVIATCNDAATALEKINRLQPDLLFLDISMPGKNGIELMQELTTHIPEVIFVTAYDDYMLQAFKFSAVDYLLKPVDETELIEAVDRAFTRINKKKKMEGLEVLMNNLRPQLQAHEIKLCVPSQYGFEVILLQDIIYCEASSSYTRFYLSNKKQVVTSKTIKEYEYLLADNFFVRVHRSFLINLRHVREYRRGEEGTITMTNGQEIKVAKRKKDLFLMKMKEYSK
ncbi:response regulator transcription factor [Niastella caeni]|uniref:Response regulator transcription factor n=1 Tax=Niastella caeni TaxID=2569763 RepID=A0A4S8HP18_9BACT|nr:LytTR family DNA-binding domain-containing protein [Niastella caeni]THU37043.1 response regulator transcription factor [Niastella caeni]